MTDIALPGFDPERLADTLTARGQQVLVMSQQAGATDAEVCLQHAQGFNISVRDQDVEQLDFHNDQDITLTVYDGQRTGSASTTDATEAGLAKLVEHAYQIAQQVEEDPCVGLADAELMASNYPDCDLYHPWALSTEQAIDMGKQLEHACLGMDKRLTQADSASVATNQQQYVYANSHGFVGVVPSTSHSVSVMLIAGPSGGSERDYEYTANCNPNKLWSMDTVAKRAVAATVNRLGAQSLTTRQCPVLFDASLARQLWGTFVSAISGGALYRKASFLCDSIDQAVLAACVSISEQPHLLGASASAPFDGEGVRTAPRNLVESGVLRGYVLSSYSARQLGLQTTANSGGVHNLIVESTEQGGLDEMLQALGTGLYVTELLGHGTNLVTGDYSQGAFGYWVENGQIKHPVNGITIAGALPKMFAGVQAIGGDVDSRGSIQTGSVLINTMTVAGHG